MNKDVIMKKNLIIEAIAKTLWKQDCLTREIELLEDGFPLPKKWLNPWEDLSYASYQKQRYEKTALDIYNSIKQFIEEKVE